MSKFAHDGCLDFNPHLRGVRVSTHALRRTSMVHRILFQIGWLCAIFITSGVQAELPDSKLTLGPPRGTLVIVGGRGSSIDTVSGEAEADRLFREFVQIAGGSQIHLVIVPTATPPTELKNPETHKDVLRARTQLKMPHVKVLHLSSREAAQAATAVQILQEAQAVWFTGGRQWRLVDIYGGTPYETAFGDVLKRGGTIGGSSAGATIQGSFLVRGDTSGNAVLIGDHQRGFGFLSNAAIDQHVISRNRQKDLAELLKDVKKEMLPTIDRESLLGIGIDEDSAVVVQGNQLSVIGKPDAQVLIYNPREWSTNTQDNKTYLTLQKGDRYDVRLRQLIHADKPSNR